MRGGGGGGGGRDPFFFKKQKVWREASASLLYKAPPPLFTLPPPSGYIYVAIRGGGGDIFKISLRQRPPLSYIQASPSPPCITCQGGGGGSGDAGGGGRKGGRGFVKSRGRSSSTRTKTNFFLRREGARGSVKGGGGHIKKIYFIFIYFDFFFSYL